jgi:hypothetical protein
MEQAGSPQAIRPLDSKCTPALGVIQTPDGESVIGLMDTTDVTAAGGPQAARP